MCNDDRSARSSYSLSLVLNEGLERISLKPYIHKTVVLNLADE